MNTQKNTDHSSPFTNDGICEQPTVVENCQDGWCIVQPGCFRFGSKTTEPCRSAYSETQVYVTLTHPFVIAETEVTQAEWEAEGFPNPSYPPQCEDCPVSMINWYETLAYCNVLSARDGFERCYDLACCEGRVGDGCDEGSAACLDGFVCNCEVNRFENVYECPGYRLPTVAEWEYAARAGTTTETYIGDSDADDAEDCAPDPVTDSVAWSCSNADRAMPVALKKKNGLGLYDMLGNLYEWASDPYNNTPLGGTASHLVDPHGFVTGSSNRRPIRGGCYANDPACNRTSLNVGNLINIKFSLQGFRPVRTVAP